MPRRRVFLDAKGSGRKNTNWARRDVVEIGRSAQELQATRISPIAPFLIADSMNPAALTSCPSCCNSRALARSLDTERFRDSSSAVECPSHSDPLFMGRRRTCFFSELLGSYREVGI